MASPFDPADLPTGIMMTLSPLVRRVLAPNPSPFTYTGTQTYVVGGEAVAVIDPGPDQPDHLSAIARAIGRSSRSCAPIPIATTARRRGP